MKNVLRIAAILLILMSILPGCASNVENKITFRNIASNKVYINFRASIIEVNAGATTVLTELPKGTYAYETTYEVPAGATSYKTEGAVSGQFTLKAGTKILVVYSSSYSDGVYTLGASVTTSDDLSDTGDSDPLNP